MATSFIFLIGIFTGVMISVMYDKAHKASEEAKDPEVHVLTRTIYWISNIHSAYNQAQQLFDENADKIELIELSIADAPYTHNKFYCKYRSIGNKWKLDLELGFEDTPYVKLVKNEEANEENKS